MDFTGRLQEAHRARGALKTSRRTRSEPDWMPTASSSRPASTSLASSSEGHNVGVQAALEGQADLAL